MGCNCGKSSQQKFEYRFTGPDGKVKVYTSEVQARAAQIRQGGGSYVPVAK